MTIHTGNKPYLLTPYKEPLNKRRSAQHLKVLPTYLYILEHTGPGNRQGCTKVGISVNPQSRLIDYSLTKAQKKQAFKLYATIKCPDRPTALAFETAICQKFKPYMGKEYFMTTPDRVFKKASAMLAEFGISALNVVVSDWVYGDNDAR